MTLAELQDVIGRTHGERDRSRSPSATVVLLTEETGAPGRGPPPLMVRLAFRLSEVLCITWREHVVDEL